MNVKPYHDGKLITLSKAFDSRLKSLNAFNFLLFFATGSFFLKKWVFLEPTVGLTIFMLGVVTVFYMVAYRFANKAAYSEKIFADKTRLQLIRQGLFQSKTKSFEPEEITSFRYLNKPELNRHPLAGDSIDYLGFQTQQKLINELHGDKRLAFDYQGRMITFGENVSSWEFDELWVLLYDITGYDLTAAHPGNDKDAIPLSPSSPSLQ